MPTVDFVLAERERQRQEAEKKRQERKRFFEAALNAPALRELAELPELALSKELSDALERKRLAEAQNQPPVRSRFQEEQEQARYLVPITGEPFDVRAEYERKVKAGELPPSDESGLLTMLLSESVIPEPVREQIKRVPIAGPVAERYLAGLTTPVGILTTLVAPGPMLGGTAGAVGLGTTGRALEEAGAPTVKVGPVRVGPGGVGEAIGATLGAGAPRMIRGYLQGRRWARLGVKQIEEDARFIYEPGTPAPEIAEDPRFYQIHTNSPIVATVDEAVTEASNVAKGWMTKLGDVLVKTPATRPLVHLVNPGKYWHYMDADFERIREAQTALVARRQYHLSIQDLMLREDEKVWKIDPQTNHVLNFAQEPPPKISREWHDVFSRPMDYRKYLTPEQMANISQHKELFRQLRLEEKARGIGKMFATSDDEYVPRVVSQHTGIETLMDAKRKNVLGKSGHFRGRYYEFADEALEDHPDGFRYLNSPAASYASRAEAGDHLMFWDDLAKTLAERGETPRERALRLFPAEIKRYMKAERTYQGARAALARAERSSAYFITKSTPEGILTPKLRKPSKVYLKKVELLQDRIAQRRATLEAARMERGDARTAYARITEQVARPKPGETTLIDLKMGDRIYNKNFARSARILMGRQGGMLDSAARTVSGFNNLFRPLMAAGDFSWWMIQGLLGIGGAEPAFLRGMGIGYGSMAQPDIYFNRIWNYQRTGLLKRYFDAGGMWYGTDIPTEWGLPLALGRRLEKLPGMAQAAKAAQEAKVAGALPRWAGRALARGYPLKPFVEGFNRSSNFAGIELFDSWSRLADDLIALDAANVGRGVQSLAPKLRGVLQDLAAGKEPTFKPVSTKLARGTTRAFGPVGEQLATATRADIDREIAAVVNKARGTLNMAMLGASPTQQALEGSFLFAPRYVRAYMGLISDAIQGGMRGNRARYFLARGLAGLALDYTMAGRFVFQQEPDFDPRSPRFLTYEWKGAHIGLGSGSYGLIRMVASATQARSLDDWLSLENNPFLRRLNAMASPALNLLWDTARKRTYIGEPLNDPLAVAQHAMVSGLPFALQSLIEEGPTAAVATFAGARAYPVLGWEWRDRARDLAAEQGFEKFGWRDKETNQPLTKWDQLNEAQQKQALQETEAGKQAQHYAQKWQEIAANQGRKWAVKEQLYDEFRSERTLTFARAVVAAHKGEMSPPDLVRVRQAIGKELRVERERLDKEYGTGEEPQSLLEDTYADLYLFTDADKDGDGNISDAEWAEHQLYREILVAKAAKDGINLPKYALERAGIFWGHPVLDKAEREYQQMLTLRDQYYQIPRWQGFSRVESEKIDTYLRYIPAYTEQLQRAAVKAGYAEDVTQQINKPVAREILRQNLPPGLNEREQLLFQLALRLDGDPDLREKLDGGYSSPCFDFLRRNPLLVRWFPQTATGLSAAERLGLPQYNEPAEQIMAETRVTTDTETVRRMLAAIEEATGKAKKRKKKQ